MSKKRNPDELDGMGSVAGVMLSIIEMLKSLVREMGGTFADVYRLATPEGTDDLKAIAAIIARGAKKAIGFPVTYDQSLGLMELIKRALGTVNDRNLESDITPERFPLKGTGVRTVRVRVEPFLDGETGVHAAERLVAAGHVLADIGDLAGFFADHPREVKKWDTIVALSEDSRWVDADGLICVPCVDKVDSDGFILRCFCDDVFFYTIEDDESKLEDGVLVLCE